MYWERKINRILKFGEAVTDIASSKAGSAFKNILDFIQLMRQISSKQARIKDNIQEPGEQFNNGELLFKNLTNMLATALGVGQRIARVNFPVCARLAPAAIDGAARLFSYKFDRNADDALVNAVNKYNVVAISPTNLEYMNNNVAQKRYAFSTPPANNTNSENLDTIKIKLEDGKEQEIYYRDNGESITIGDDTVLKHVDGSLPSCNRNGCLWFSELVNYGSDITGNALGAGTRDAVNLIMEGIKNCSDNIKKQCDKWNDKYSPYLSPVLNAASNSVSATLGYYFPDYDNIASSVADGMDVVKKYITLYTPKTKELGKLFQLLMCRPLISVIDKTTW